MQTIIGAAGIASAIAGSVGLALWIEWLSLRGLMHLMPAPAPQRLSVPKTGQKF